jgi:hypothetical protein
MGKDYPTLLTLVGDPKHHQKFQILNMHLPWHLGTSHPKKQL